MHCAHHTRTLTGWLKGTLQRFFALALHVRGQSEPTIVYRQAVVLHRYVWDPPR